MKGQPKYNYGDAVSISIGGVKRYGVIETIDKFGTFYDDTDVCYDVYCAMDNILYKHINEKDILCAHH